MLKITVDSDKIINSLTKLVGNFQRTGTSAVRKAGEELTANIIVKTLGPPPGPPPTSYVRTWRLVHGWGPAAKFFSIPIPNLTSFALTANDEGTLIFSEDERQTFFRAQNLVPYANEVEFFGTWQAPGGPFAEPPNFRPAYNIVGSSLEEESGHFPEYVEESWREALNAS